MAKRMKIDPHYQQQKCSPMTSFRKYKVYADIRGGSPGQGHQMTAGLSTAVIFGYLGGYIFENVRDKPSNITRLYATPCWPVIDCKMNELE